MEPSKPRPVFLLALALPLGAAVAFSIIWLFGIEISEVSRFKVFPDGWSLLELFWNATAGVLIVGSIRACYVALHSHYYGDKTDEPPNPGAGA